MSLILEALRRSEAERQFGRAPDVFTPMPVLRAARRARRWPWWVACARLLVVGSAWLGWRHVPRAAPTMPTDTSDALSVVATTPPSIDPPATVAAGGSPGAGLQHSIGTSSPAPKSIVVAPAPAMPAPPIAAIPIMHAPAAPPPLAAASDNEAARTAAASDANTASADADVLQSIADLSPGERQGLPALKVSMHVYAEQPGDRFMIVDGARIGEGARIGDRIVLVRIRRDGGVLDFGGRRLLLPKP